jgi:hypothetical protein
LTLKHLHIRQGEIKCFDIKTLAYCSYFIDNIIFIINILIFLFLT